MVSSFFACGRTALYAFDVCGFPRSARKTTHETVGKYHAAAGEMGALEV
jgi:hypothetical protein